MKNSRMIKVIGLVILVGFLGINILAQAENTKNNKDQTRRGSATVNLTSLGLELSIPMGNLPGRAGNSTPISFNYSSKVWRMDTVQDTVGNPVPVNVGYPIYGEKSFSGWTPSIQEYYVEDTSIVKNLTPPSNGGGSGNGGGGGGGGGHYDCGFTWTGVTCNFIPRTSTLGNATIAYYIIPKKTVHFPDGSTVDLVASITPIYVAANSPHPTFDEYYSIDGSNLRFKTINGESYLYFPSGNKYEFSNRKLIDRNGNIVSQFVYNQSSQTYTRKDSMGRTIPAIPIPNPLSTSEDLDYFVPTMPNKELKYTFKWRKLAASFGNATHPHSVRVLGYLFPNHTYNIVENQQHNPLVLREIVLPDGKSYQFSYNEYGEIEKVLHPTGSEEVFIHHSVTPFSYGGGLGNYQRFGNRGVKEHRIRPNAGSTTGELTWQYQVPRDEATLIANAPYRVEKIAPDGIKTVKYLFVEPGGNTSQGLPRLPSLLAGRVYEERVYKANNELVGRSLTNWDGVDPIAVTNGSPSPDVNAYPKASRTASIIIDGSNALAQSQTMAYSNDNYLNVVRSTTFDFVPLTLSTAQDSLISGISLGTPLKTTETTYSTNTNYIAKQMVSMPLLTTVKTGDEYGQIVAKTENSYDDSGYGILPSDNLTGNMANTWTDPNTIYRGNHTTTKVWDNINNVWISTHAQFDQYGNRRKTFDAKGISSEVQYSTDYACAYPTKSISAIPDSTGVKGSNTAFETTTTYDYTTGLPLTSTDINGQITTIEYNDVFLRPTKVTPPTGAGVAETIYHDEVNNAWVKTRKQIDANNWAESISYFDGLGRNYKAEEVNSQGNIFVEKEFDQDGRVKRVTNPYRTGEAKQWATNVYDEQSRVIEVILPDGAKVKTDYGVATTGLIGLTKQITDQALKKRRSITNALGQLIRVDEPDANGNLGDIATPNQPTYYVYDILSNLTTVKQGGTFENPVQTRTFVYDSLSRLKSANNPESGIINYDYDNNGNLTSKTDARNVVTTYIYDNLNRVTNRNYAAPTGLLNYQTTPNVTYKYDNLTNAKGKLISVANSVSETKYLEFDTLGRITSSQQITDGIAYNPMTYTYNLSGALVEQKYPSGKIIRNFLDQEGDLSRVVRQGKTFASDFNYTSAGAVSSMKLV
jgi:YD repeat-containing protein